MMMTLLCKEGKNGLFFGFINKRPVMLNKNYKGDILKNFYYNCNVKDLGNIFVAFPVALSEKYFTIYSCSKFVRIKQCVKCYDGKEKVLYQKDINFSEYNNISDLLGELDCLIGYDKKYDKDVKKSFSEYQKAKEILKINNVKQM